VTRLDRMLIAEQRDYGFIDLRPRQDQRYLIRENGHFLIDRAKRLELSLSGRGRAGALGCL
jgi:hypothetical protein